MNSDSQLPVVDAGGLTQQIRDLSVAIRLFFTLVIVALAALTVGAFTLVVPRFEKIFDDMIPGGGTKLPELTQRVLEWSRLAPVPQLVIMAISVGGVIALWRFRSNRDACLTALLAMFLLVAHWMVIVVSCFMPLIWVIQNLGSGH